jgi:hypothetical protein
MLFSCYVYCHFDINKLVCMILAYCVYDSGVDGMIAFWQLRIDIYSTQFVWILPILHACIYSKKVSILCMFV